MTDLHDDLDAYMADDDAWDIDTDPEPITSEIDAERWLRRRRRILADKATIEQVRADQQARLDAWHADRVEGTDRALAYIDRQLDGWMRAHVATGGAQTVTLPSGTIKATRQQPEWRYTDESAFVEWAQTYAPDLLRLPEPKPPAPAPDKTAVKKTLAKLVSGQPGEVVEVPWTATTVDDDTGEIVDVNLGTIPGLEVEFRPMKVTPEVDL